jgi:hypothetical protein
MELAAQWWRRRRLLHAVTSIRATGMGRHALLLGRLVNRILTGSFHGVAHPIARGPRHWLASCCCVPCVDPLVQD